MCIRDSARTVRESADGDFSAAGVHPRHKFGARSGGDVVRRPGGGCGAVELDFVRAGEGVSYLQVGRNEGGANTTKGATTRSRITVKVKSNVKVKVRVTGKDSGGVLRYGYCCTTFWSK